MEKFPQKLQTTHPTFMTVEEVLHLIQTRAHKDLTPIQEMVLRQTWEGQTYCEMAKVTHYAEDYLRKIAFGLWSSLSDLFNETITKKNCRFVLEQHLFTSKEQWLIEESSRYDSTSQLEWPDRPVPLNCPFYVRRPPIEELTCTAISQPGSLIRLKAPRQMGKTSLMVRILARAREQGYRAISLNLQQADRAMFANLDRFLRWFCVILSRQLKLPAKANDRWDDIFGSKSNCTIYLEDYVLCDLNSPLVIALDRVDELFLYPEIADDFFGLLRYWHEKATYGDIRSQLWQNLRLVLVYSTEVYMPLDTNRSPFNVGFVHELPSFTHSQVEDLARRHQLHLSSTQIEQLMQLVAGHPYLVRLAFYHLARQELTWKELIQTAATDAGIYHHHLHQYLGSLQAHPNLAAAYQQVLKANQPVELEQQLAFKLCSLGLVNLHENAVNPRCELYWNYFRVKMTS